MKRIQILLTIFFIVISLSFFATAHSGRTDGRGGHNSSSGYHYHHGYPAHQHINGECPYKFDDKTNSSPSNSNTTATTNNTKKNKEKKSSPLISHNDFIIFGTAIISLFGCAYCPSWIKNAKTSKERFYGIFSLISCFVLLIILLYLKLV